MNVQDLALYSSLCDHGMLQVIQMKQAAAVECR